MHHIHRLAVLVSGTGSLLEAMFEQGLTVDLVLADRPCRGINEVTLNRPEVETKLLPRKNFRVDDKFDRTAYTLAVLEVLHERNISVVAMAGFLTILSKEMFRPIGLGGYLNRIMNIHPSLLPKYKGDHAVKDALESGDKVTGTTIHIATEELDDETDTLAQEQVPILEGDTVEILHERIKEVERVLYPQVIRRFMQGLSETR